MDEKIEKIHTHRDAHTSFVGEVEYGSRQQPQCCGCGGINSHGEVAALAGDALEFVVNHAAGRADSADAISMDGIARVLETAMDKVRALLEHVVPLVELP